MGTTNNPSVKVRTSLTLTCHNFMYLISPSAIAWKPHPWGRFTCKEIFCIAFHHWKMPVSVRSLQINGLPPPDLLSIGIHPTTIWIFGTFQCDVGTSSECKPGPRECKIVVEGRIRRTKILSNSVQNGDIQLVYAPRRRGAQLTEMIASRNGCRIPVSQTHLTQFGDSHLESSGYQKRTISFLVR